MERRLFLSGPAFCGKSRLIRESLGKRLQSAGGFCTELGSGEEGSSAGCFLMPAAMAGGVEGFEKERFLDLGSYPPAHDSEVFRGLGVKLLEESEWYPFAVLDEIGGIDLIIPQFRGALESLLASPLPLIGVIKTEEAAEQMRKAFGLGDRFSGFSERLHGMLRSDPETRIVEIEADAGAEAGEAVREWIAEYAVFPA